MIKLTFGRLLSSDKTSHLTWLDVKRVQDPITPSDKQFINDTISSKESFESGWLNDEVIFKQIHA